MITLLNDRPADETPHGPPVDQQVELDDRELTFRTYVESIWLPQHVLEAVTRQTYTYFRISRMLRASAAVRQRRSPRTNGATR